MSAQAPPVSAVRAPNLTRYVAQKLISEHANGSRSANDVSLDVQAGPFEVCLAAEVDRVLAERDEASAALDELVAPDETKSLAQRIRDEFADFHMLMDHVTTVYVHFSRDRISKPTTLPSEVIRVAEDFESKDIDEAIKEARDEWEQETRALREALAQTWQPISTAPKDVVLLYRPQLPPRDRIALKRASDWCGPDCCPSAEPTHWMPLLASPGAQKET